MESILYTPSLNQHNTTRSVHMETQSKAAPSIRVQCKAKAASRDKHKHIDCLSLALTHSAKLVRVKTLLC